MGPFRVALAVAVALGLGSSGMAARPSLAIQTDDVTRFFEIYDAANGLPKAGILQQQYIEPGSPGLHDFIPYRIVSGENLAASIARSPDMYRRARECLRIIPDTKSRLYRALGRLKHAYPSARLAPVTILVGAGNSGGTSGPSGVIIGLEVACSADWLQTDLSDRLFVLVMHEYGHVQQSAELNSEAAPSTVLRQSLIEGVAELVAKLTTGEVSNSHLAKWTRGRELQIDAAFLKEVDSSDLSHWLYNGEGTPEKPGDLGYWVGYRIAKAYYDKAHDKRAALKALLELKDPKAILAASGWKPGA